ncbi:MAG: DMT family transporter [Hoeflea sp.]|uniref:DMT family transporter n=1 Tax=Hoeflea sp. TaxID=1940281 RepID=UPI001DCFDA38|nr:DMT family transporter [Hoeflea sp.]MBU4529982.1 DMT family transporter [Alphaproteobacteria bacterium]MBU4543209.1 DMT family transporter [Alphaproteobacteria bacterium]MBU4550251.1 DMT family transporter [Alphaproteobacteria bacterium]MBV1722475.1 DMT family transporter [Hoeflea sp.]MBV1761625.1 DMT family transporter [Hoeflea sp.]
MSEASGSPASIRPASPAPAHPLAGLAIGFVGVVIFGGTLPATHVALEGFSPAFITFCRAAIAASVAAVALLVLRKRFPRQHALSLFTAGVLLIYGFPGFSSVAMQTVPAAHGGVVLGVLPLMTATFAALFGGERPGLAFWAWSITGAALVMIFSLSGADIEPGIGDLWLACAALSASCGYVISGKLARTRPGWEVISWALVITAPLSLAGTWFAWDTGISTPGTGALTALLYLSLGSMFAGFIFWNWGMAIGGIARVGQVQLLQSFVTLGLSALILGETVTPVMLGFAIAVGVVVWCGRKAKVG